MIDPGYVHIHMPVGIHVDKTESIFTTSLIPLLCCYT